MLEQLLAIKRRREGRLRQQLAAGNQRYERLQNSLAAINQERLALQEEWRQLSREGRGKLARERLHQIQRQLEEHFQHDRTLEGEIIQAEMDSAAWLAEKKRVQEKIVLNRIEQEKLRYMLEEGTNED